MASAVHAIIFDLDGTLLNTITDIANCSNTVLTRWMCPTFPVTRYTELVGDGLSNLARKVLPPGRNSSNDVAAFVEEYRLEYKDRWNETSSHYSGIPELLEELTTRGVPLAVLSNKRDDFTQVCVSEFFPNTPFKVVRGEREGCPIKPDPTSALEIAQKLGVNPGHCLFVGDSEIDVLTAKSAGMRSVGVLWGFRSRHTLEEAGCEVCIETPQEMLCLV
jgi:phosphoglycolate phosphatase